MAEVPAPVAQLLARKAAVMELVNKTFDKAWVLFDELSEAHVRRFIVWPISCLYPQVNRRRMGDALHFFPGLRRMLPKSEKSATQAQWLESKLKPIFWIPVYFEFCLVALQFLASLIVWLIVFPASAFTIVSLELCVFVDLLAFCFAKAMVTREKKRLEQNMLALEKLAEDNPCRKLSIVKLRSTFNSASYLAEAGKYDEAIFMINRLSTEYHRRYSDSVAKTTAKRLQILLEESNTIFEGMQDLTDLARSFYDRLGLMDPSAIVLANKVLDTLFNNDWDGKMMLKYFNGEVEFDRYPAEETCIVCMSEPPSVTMLPCGHTILCRECCDMADSQVNDSFGRRCEMCRSMAFGVVPCAEIDAAKEEASIWFGVSNPEGEKRSARRKLMFSAAKSMISNYCNCVPFVRGMIATAFRLGSRVAMTFAGILTGLFPTILFTRHFMGKCAPDGLNCPICIARMAIHWARHKLPGIVRVFMF